MLHVLVEINEFYADKVWRLDDEYDYSLSSLQGYSGGSHELSLSITIRSKRDFSTLSPRYF
ncbi:MAG: hypothetical protein KJ712_02305 [Bacteroidetes bacterium]|nr:hypothetical protein [Bacteroidota bacterium]MBU1484623.1 hypothetical protein [Bacteroidota bacterium]MBU2045548.1 hypothetical protein [Bacteroidota bacterium]MBU2269099.1 hypothetical protein [Bacteroidota bacterium]MBU2376017.1 hypothetical protein [Bacteroidota bacterium]